MSGIGTYLAYRPSIDPDWSVQQNSLSGHFLLNQCLKSNSELDITYMMSCTTHMILFLQIDSLHHSLFNPVTLRMVKPLWSFGHSECNRVNQMLHKMSSAGLRKHDIPMPMICQSSGGTRKKCPTLYVKFGQGKWVLIG